MIFRIIKFIKKIKINIFHAKKKIISKIKSKKIYRKIFVFQWIIFVIFNVNFKKNWLISWSLSISWAVIFHTNTNEFKYYINEKIKLFLKYKSILDGHFFELSLYMFNKLR